MFSWFVHHQLTCFFPFSAGSYETSFTCCEDLEAFSLTSTSPKLHASHFYEDTFIARPRPDQRARLEDRTGGSDPPD